MTAGVEHLQEAGGARGRLRPRVEGQSVKIAETILRRRQTDLQEKAQRADNLRKLRKANKLSLRTNRVKSAQHFVAKAVKAIKDSKRVRVQRNRMVKKQRKPEARVYCVVRNSRKGGCRATREALARLGLTRPYSCTFIANDKEANATLRKVSPFVFYGLPKEDTVRRLFLTRGCMRVEGEGETAPQPLSDNVMVEEAFGSLGIVCLEDLIDEVVTCGPHFKEVMQKVGKFQLADLKAVEGLEAKRVEFGFLGAKIDVKITQLT